MLNTELFLIITGSVYFLLALISIIYYIIISNDKITFRSEYNLPPLVEEPFVSIIVPTYNEEKNIADCVRSLKTLNYTNYEIILTDGGSTDKTIELAKEFVDHIIIEDKLPNGWVGKNYGCHLAYKKAKGDILLFTDADTKHKPDSLREIVNILVKNKVGLLSLIPYQELEKWWETIVPINFFISNIISAGKGNVNNPKRRFSFVALGQYMMFTRETYEKIGGHERLKDSIIEDYAFARLVKTKYQTLYFMESTKLVSARMYPDSLKDGWYGFKKCLYAGVKLTPPRRIFITVCFILWGIFSPAAIIVSAIFSNWAFIVITSLLYVLYPMLIWTYWKGKGNHHALIYVIHPIQLIMFLVTIIVSTFELLVKKTTTWKGRIYKPNLTAGLEVFHEKPAEDYGAIPRIELEEDSTVKEKDSKPATHTDDIPT